MTFCIICNCENIHTGIKLFRKGFTVSWAIKVKKEKRDCSKEFECCDINTSAPTVTSLYLQTAKSPVLADLRIQAGEYE